MVNDTELAGNIESSPEPEKTLTVSEVNNIVKREKTRAAEQARQQAEAQYKAELEKLQGQPAANNGGFDKDALKKELLDDFYGDLEAHQEQVHRQTEETRLKKIADQYYLKMGKGSEIFDDFKEVISGFDPSAFPNVVMTVAEMENTPELMYELVNNPSKLQLIDSLAQRSPELAKKELTRIANSIKSNLDAKASHASAPAPLSRPKPSTVGADNGKMTLKDYKSAPWLRG